MIILQHSGPSSKKGVEGECLIIKDFMPLYTILSEGAEIFQQLQTCILTFFWMKLNPPQIVFTYN